MVGVEWSDSVDPNWTRDSREREPEPQSDGSNRGLNPHGHVSQTVTHDVREATPADAADVVRLLDAAMLRSDPERVRRRVAAGDVLVAVVAGAEGADRQGAESATADRTADRIVGACVLAPGGDVSTEWCGGASAGDASPTEIEQITVHRSRRGRGVGTGLVDAAAARSAGPLVARFRHQVRPFYDALGFEIVDASDVAGEPGEADEADEAGEADEVDEADEADRSGRRRLCGILR